MEREIVYLQIDYLRLFRLARRLKYINKDRKNMPKSYNCKLDAIKCCRRLFKSFLLKAFKGFVVKNSEDKFILFSKENIELFRYFYRYNWHSDEFQIEDKFRELVTMSCIRLDNYFKIVLSTSFFNYRKIGQRPMERFYDAAVVAIKYKKLLDEVTPILLQIRNKIENEKIEKAIENKIVEKTIENKIVEKTIENKIVEKTTSQIIFDRALDKYLKGNLNL